MSQRRARPASSSSREPIAADDRLRSVLIALLLGALTVATYWPVRSFDFVNYDDHEFVLENPHINTGISVPNLQWAVENPYWATGGPLTWVSHMLDVEVGGLDSGPHHVTNLLLHTVNTVLLFFVLRSLTGGTWPSALVGALFAVHPLHVESVAWVSQRKDLLSGSFWILAMAAYVPYVRRGGAWRYLVLLSAFVGGLLSKPMVATLPFVLLLLDVWPLRRFPLSFAALRGSRKVFLEKLPFICLAAAALLLTFIEQRRTGAISSFETVPLGMRLSNGVVSYAAYLWKTVWPGDLIPFYPFRSHLPPVTVVGSGMILAAITGGAMAFARRAPWLFTGWFWFVGTLVPVIGIVQVGGHAMADRFTYLPLIGIFISIAWGIASITARWPRTLRLALATTVCLLVVACAVTARAQALYWRNGVALWEHTVAVDPGNSRALGNLGVALAKAGRRDEAIEAYRTSLHLGPETASTHNNLALALASGGQHAEAMVHYERAVSLRPGYTNARVNLANLLDGWGRSHEARAHYLAALEADPENVLARANLAISYARGGELEEAVPLMMEAADREPANAHWRYMAGVMLIQAGRTTEGAAALERVLAIDPAHQAARQALASVRR